MSQKSGDGLPLLACVGEVVQPRRQTNIGDNKKSSPGSTKKTGSRNRTRHNFSKRNLRTVVKNGNIRTGVDDDNCSNDINSILKASKKGQNISHLLSYSYINDESDYFYNDYKPREKHQKPFRRNNKPFRTEIHLSGLSYINANYKFILKHDGDYRAQMLDPNLPLDTNSIARVMVKQHDYHCPICLGDEFVAPRMTNCGHIFCYPCLLDMFENARNDKSKTSLGNMHNPFISCPLCSETIRERNPLLPVLIEHVHTGSSKVSEKTYVTLPLMHREKSKIYSQQVSNFYQSKAFRGSIPWISSNCTPLNFKQYSPYINHSRLILSDTNFVLACFNKEIDDLMTQKLIDCEMYGSSSEPFDKAIVKIKELVSILENERTSSTKITRAPPQAENASLENIMAGMSLSEEVTLPPYNEGYYYYECDVNSRIHYFLSPLDTLVIKHLFGMPLSKEIDESLSNPAYNLPLALNLYIENINSEEGRVTPELVSKNPYLGNIPYGAEIEFLEIDWTKFDNSFIPLNENDTARIFTDSKYPIQIPPSLVKKLQARTRNIRNKRTSEEKARIRGERRRERETLEVFNRDDNRNALAEEEDEIIDMLSENRWERNEFVHIDPVSNTPMLKGVVNPLRPFDAAHAKKNVTDNNETGTGGSVGSDVPLMTTQTSVWGTRVPVVLDPEEEALQAEETREVEEMIRKAKAQALSNGKKGKKGRKVKMVPLPM